MKRLSARFGRRFMHCSVAALFLAATAPAHAVDGMALVYGEADDNDNVDMFRLSARWDWDHRWFDDGGWYLAG